MDIWKTLRRGARKLELEESKNFIIPGDGDDMAAAEMVLGSVGSAIVSVAGIGITTVGTLSVPVAALVWAGFAFHGCKKAYDLHPDRFWYRVFEKSNLKIDKKHPELTKDILLENGREFRFKLPIGMSIEDFKNKQSIIESAFSRKIDILLDESTYQVKVFLHKPVLN